MSKTVNRGWLKKQVALGKVEAKCDYRMTDDYKMDVANNFGTMTKFIPCILRADNGKRIDGKINFTDWDFKTKCGCAYWENETEKTIGLIIHSNLAYTLKITA
jgi:hypothetical protein